MTPEIFSDIDAAECVKCHKSLVFADAGIEAVCCGRLYWAEEVILVHSERLPKKK